MKTAVANEHEQGWDFEKAAMPYVDSLYNTAYRMTRNSEDAEDLVHILSPFDPLINQRKRLHLFFDYEHRFEAYVPKEKRVFGYFAQPVLVGDEIVAVLDLKTDREREKLLVQKWTWLRKDRRKELRRKIESELDRFERFQLAR